MNTFNSKSNANPLGNFKGLYVLIAIAVLAILLFSKTFVKIDSGHAGLVYHTFSDGIDVNDPPLTQGLQFILPWNDVIHYEIRQMENTRNMTVLSSNLLDIKLDMTIFYQPILSELAELETTRGANFEKVVIEPAVFAVTREVIAKYLPEEINTTKRELIQEEVKTEMEKKLAANHLQLNDILIQNIELPINLRESIEKKLQQEQESLEYEYRIQKATKEAERKRIEAQGIQDFQNIVAKSITPQLLKWKGIEATEALAKAEGSQTVIIGAGDDGLPLILGGN